MILIKLKKKFSPLCLRKLMFSRNFYFTQTVFTMDMNHVTLFNLEAAEKFTSYGCNLCPNKPQNFRFL